MTVIDGKFLLRRIQSTRYRKDLYFGFNSKGEVFWPGLFVPTLDLNHTTVISPVHSKTDFRQLARTPRDFVGKTCLTGAPLIDIDGAVSRVLNLCLGCIQSQLVSNEPITDIKWWDLDLNKSQSNRHYQKQKIDECHPHTSQADNGTENLGSRYYKGTVKVPRLFPEECRRIKKILLVKVLGILRPFDLYLEVDI